MTDLNIILLSLLVASWVYHALASQEWRRERARLINHIVAHSASDYAAMMWGPKALKSTVDPGVYPSMSPEQEAKIAANRGQAPVVMTKPPTLGREA